jgi:3-oxoacyl-[acyl-carrier protein] reductase
MNLSGIRAIVTGATGGIGSATVKALLEKGVAQVGLLARNEEKVRAAMDAFSSNESSRVLPLVADVRSPDDLTKAFDAFVQAAGGLEVLVNNAGVLLDGALVSFSFRGVQRYSLENWQNTLETNLRSVFLCSQLAVERMFRKRCKGVIVNISSISRQGRAGQTAYSASKGGIASLTATLAQELAPYAIRCAAIAPGLVDTPMAAQIPEEARKNMLEHVAVGRMGRAAEIAHGVLFCVENDFFNGRMLELDGGAFG